jgi:hypothetical protein
MDFRDKWFANLLERRGLPLSAPIALLGECRRHIGPTMQIASVEFVVVPSDHFDVVNEVALTVELADLKFPDYAIFGFLDVAMPMDSIGINSIKLLVKTVGVDAIESSALALREAGRDAARKLLQILKTIPISAPARDEEIM